MAILELLVLKEKCSSLCNGNSSHNRKELRRWLRITFYKKNINPPTFPSLLYLWDFNNFTCIISYAHKRQPIPTTELGPFHKTTTWECFHTSVPEYVFGRRYSGFLHWLNNGSNETDRCFNCHLSAPAGCALAKRCKQLKLYRVQWRDLLTMAMNLMVPWGGDKMNALVTSTSELCIGYSNRLVCLKRKLTSHNFQWELTTFIRNERPIYMFGEVLHQFSSLLQTLMKQCDSKSNLYDKPLCRSPTPSITKKPSKLETYCFIWTGGNTTNSDIVNTWGCREQNADNSYCCISHINYA